MSWFTCHVLASNICREDAEDVNAFRYSVSVEAEDANKAEAKARKIVQEKANYWQHPRFFEPSNMPPVKVTKISKPMKEPEFPLGSKVEWFNMSEINK